MKYLPHKALSKILQQSKRQAFYVGVMIGLIASWLYLLTGGSTFLSVPKWAEIVFYPGFFAGFYFYNLFRAESLAILFGSLTVGLFYGIVFVVILSLWKLFAHRKKYVITVLCLITIVTGMLFLNKLFSSPSDACHSISQEFTLAITSNPSGAKIYPLYNWGQPDLIGTTPAEFNGSYSIDRDGSGWWISGRGINFKSTEQGILVLLNCIVVKDGYVCQEVAPVLETIPKNIAHPNQMPSEFKYNAKLISNDSPCVNKIGQAVLVNGAFLGVNPPSLKLTEGTYIIDIKSAK